MAKCCKKCGRASFWTNTIFFEKITRLIFTCSKCKHLESEDKAKDTDLSSYEDDPG